MAALPIVLGASLFGNLLSGIFGSNAAKNASNQQVAAGREGLQFQKDVWGQQQANQKPFLEAGTWSIGQIMDMLKSGKLGPGSLPSFTAPTAEEARATPGYQFTAQQGSKGILQGAAAAGGAISGGTLKALDTFNSGLADTTYGNTFNRSLATYQQNLQKQAQEFGQMFAPAQLGEQATQNLNTAGSQASFNVGNLMSQIGNAQAAGTVGSANAITGAIGGGTNSLMQSLLLSKIFSPPTPGTGPGLPFGVNPIYAGNSLSGGSVGAGPSLPPGMGPA